MELVDDLAQRLLWLYTEPFERVAVSTALCTAQCRGRLNFSVCPRVRFSGRFLFPCQLHQSLRTLRDLTAPPVCRHIRGS